MSPFCALLPESDIRSSCCHVWFSCMDFSGMGSLSNPVFNRTHEQIHWLSFLSSEHLTIFPTLLECQSKGRSCGQERRALWSCLINRHFEICLFSLKTNLNLQDLMCSLYLFFKKLLIMFIICELVFCPSPLKVVLYANFCFAFLAAKIDNGYGKVHVFKWSPVSTAEPVMEWVHWGRMCHLESRTIQQE